MLAMVMAVAFGIEAKRIVGYVTSWSNVMPDPKLLTNINYAFGHVNDTFDGVRIDNPDRLKRIAPSQYLYRQVHTYQPPCGNRLQTNVADCHLQPSH